VGRALGAVLQSGSTGGREPEDFSYGMNNSQNRN
jgi:hypothetical protein